MKLFLLKLCTGCFKRIKVERNFFKGKESDRHYTHCIVAIMGDFIQYKPRVKISTKEYAGEKY